MADETPPRGLPLTPMANGLPLAPPQPMPSLGPSPMQQMIGQNIQRELQMETQRGPVTRFLNDLSGNDPLVATKVANAYQNQQDRLRLDYMNSTVAAMDKFSQLDPATQQAVAPLFKNYITSLNRIAGVEAPEGLIDTMMSQPGMAQTAHDIFANDKGYTDQERQMHLAAIRRLKSPVDIQNYLSKVQQDKVDTLTEQLRPAFPWLNTAVRQALGRGPRDDVNASEFVGALQNVPQFQSASGQKALAQLVEKYGPEFGVTNAKVAEQAMLEKAKNKPTDTLKSIATLMAGDPEFSSLLASKGLTLEQALSGGLDATTLQPFINRANEKLKAEKVEVAERTGIGVKLAERLAPAMPKERAQHVLISALQQGQMIQPPAGITEEQLAKNPDIAAISEDQKKAFIALQPAQTIVNTLYGMSGQLVTAQTPTEAFKQGVRLSVSAGTKSNPIASSYKDAVEAYLGNLSRSLGGEKGVLTDRDIDRVRRSLTSFFDTVQTRQLKNAIVQDLINTSKSAIIGEISGKPIDAKGQVNALLKRLDDVNNKAIIDAVGPGKMVIRDKANNMRVMPKRALTPAEAKDWEIVE